MAMKCGKSCLLLMACGKDAEEGIQNFLQELDNNEKSRVTARKYIT